MPPDWQELNGAHPPRAVALLRALYETPGTFSVTIRDLASESGTSREDAEALLERLVTDGLLTRKRFRHCSRGHDLADSDTEECPECHVAFVDEPPTEDVRYLLRREPPRDVPWVLVLHGMNTPGTWQELLSWLIARSYRRMVPVAIYKYGIVRPGVLFRWRQRMIRKRLADKIAELSGQARSSGYGGKPDVIAHSFGTWLIADALANDDRIRIGRLILLGCIVPPDFDWQALIDDRRVERIMNHGGTADFWVRVAQYAIPSSGPGGVRGFPPPVTNVAAQGLGHSAYFTSDERMHALFSDLWQPFLSWANPPAAPHSFIATAWKPLPRIVTIATRWIVIAAASLIAFVAVRLICAAATLLFGGIW